MGAFIELFKKDVIVEARQREATATLLFLAILLSVIAAFGVEGSFLEPPVIVKIAPALYWMVFVVIAAITVGKTSEYDRELRAIDGVVLTGVPLPLVYTAKTAANFLLIWIGQLITLGCFVVLLDLSIGDITWRLVLVSALVVTAYSSLVTLLSAIASASRIRSLLLPLIALPLLLPLFFCGMELTAELFATRALDWGSFWVSLLLVLNIVYFVAGLNLYEYALRD